MSSGIYFIEINDKYYIGQSINMSRRLSRHLSDLKSNTHYNIKLQNAYNKYGYANMDTLEECSIASLGNLEIVYIKEFDSIDQGYNINEGGKSSSGHGYNSSAAKYTRYQWIQALDLLQEYTNKVVSVSTTTGISVEALSHMIEGDTHLWLKEEFPDKYTKMLELRAARFKYSLANKNYTNKIEAFLVQNIATKEIKEVLCIKSFAREYKIDSGDLSRLRRGIAKRVGSWRLYNKESTN